MRRLLFILLNLVWLPIYLVGLIGFIIPLMGTRGKSSGTTYEPFGARLLYDLMGTRPDAAATKLTRGLPATNWAYLYLMVYPMLAFWRLSGHTPVSFAYPPADPDSSYSLMAVRTEFLDEVVAEALQDCEQFVVLGAGWDTRAYAPDFPAHVKAFEVDTPPTQAIKRGALHKSEIDSSHVTFVPCDFNRQKWLDLLLEHGLDKNKKTMVLWEGVSMYLTEEGVAKTLEAITELGPGSAIAFDVFSSEWLIDDKLGRGSARSVKMFYGEEFTFSIPMQGSARAQLENFLSSHGLHLEHERVMYTGGDTNRPFYGFVLASNSEPSAKSKGSESLNHSTQANA